MGSKKKKALWALNYTNAYGKTMLKSEKAAIDKHNETNKAEGQQKDSNWAAERQSVAQKNGTVEYKSIVRKHRDEIGSSLGVKR